MSQENVEIAKRSVDAFNRRDVEALLNMATPDCVLSSQLLDASADFRGHEGLESFFAMLSESWEEFRSVVDDYRDLGDRVLCLGRNTARGRGSGVTVDAPTAAVLDFRDGKVLRIRLYLDQSEALGAAGLAEQRCPRTLDLVRSIYADWERGDFSRFDWADPEIEYVLADGLSPGRWVGPEAMAEAVRYVLSGWAVVRLEAEEYRQLDEKRFLVLSRSVGRFKASGLEPGELGPQAAHLFEFESGKVTALTYYFDRENALADLGLKDQSVSANLDLVRSIYADWERGDFSRFDWADPEMEYVFADGPDPASGRGHAAMWIAWHGVLSAWRDHRAIAEEYRELDDRGILALTTFRGRGEASGIELTHALARGASDSSGSISYAAYAPSQS